MIHWHDHKVMTYNGQDDTLKHRSGSNYEAISLRSVWAMATHPEAKEKPQARALMASSYNAHDGRTHEVQRQQGKFVVLRVDVDGGYHSMADIRAALMAFTGPGVATSIYSTSSATATNPKWRGLIPLPEPLAYDHWHRLQRALHRHMQGHGIQCDTIMERAGQYMAAPNVPPEKRDDTGQPLFYQYEATDGKPLDVLATGCVQAMAELEAADAAMEQARTEAVKRAAERRKQAGNGTDPARLIDAFNEGCSVAECLARYGFETRNDRDWHHPQQTSSSYSWRDYGDHWVCASSMARDLGIGMVSRNGFACGDAFDLFKHFEHGGNQSKALKDAGDNRVHIGGESWNRGKQREFMQAQAAQHQAVDVSELLAGMGKSQGRITIDAETGEVIQPTQLLKPVSVADVWTNPAPAPAFVWGQYLPRGVVSLFGAHGGTGKSTISLLLAVAVATGRPLFGVPTVPSAALFVSLEDGASVVQHRLASICRVWDINPATLEGRLHIVDGTEHPELYAAESRSAGDVTPAYMELIRLVADTGAGLVVVDNASDSFGGDEINRRQVRGFMRALGQVARQSDCAVCLLAHVDKNTSRGGNLANGEGYSGSTAWHNSARSRLFMKREDRTGLLTLEHQKSNLGKRHDPLTLAWFDGDLPMLASEAPDASGLIERLQGRQDDESAAALLALIAEFESRGQYCHTGTTSRSNPYAVLKVEPAFQKLKLGKDAVARIVNQCQRAGWLDILEYRTKDRKPHDRWTVTDKGRVFAGLPEVAPTVPTVPTSIDGAPLEMAQEGAPTAPTGVGGMGDRARTQDGAKDGAKRRKKPPTPMAKESAVGAEIGEVAA